MGYIVWMKQKLQIEPNLIGFYGFVILEPSSKRDLVFLTLFLSKMACPNSGPLFTFSPRVWCKIRHFRWCHFKKYQNVISVIFCLKIVQDISFLISEWHILSKRSIANSIKNIITFLYIIQKLLLYGMIILLQYLSKYLINHIFKWYTTLW